MMSTRFLFLAISALSSFTTLSGQVHVDPAIQAKLEAFISYSNQNQWEEAYDLVYPKLFAKISKQEIISATKEQLTGIELQRTNTEIISASAPMEEGSETFVKLEYKTDLVFHLEPNGMYDSPKATQALDENFKATYGKMNVRWDPDQKSFFIRSRESMMAIHDGDGDWKLVDINPNQPELMAFLFSPSIMEALVRIK